MVRILLGSGAALVVAFAVVPARGEERPPLPEPIFSETVTDIDATAAGELELEVNGSWLRARAGGAFAFDTSLEVEWMPLRKLGLRVEPTFSSDHDGVTSDGFGASFGASYKLVQDFAHDFHLQFEVLSRLPWQETVIVQPGDPMQPLVFDLRTAWRAGPFTMRASAGVGTLGHAEHVPLRGSFAALFPFESTGKLGFWGLEVDVDGARNAPLLVAANVMPNLGLVGIPFRVGLALPVIVGEDREKPSVGIFVRIFYESEREAEFSRPSAKACAPGTDP